MTQLLTGRCLCEQVSYQIAGDLGPIYHCHCSKCRRWHGAAFRTRTTIRKSQLTWLSGEDLLKSYPSSEGVRKTFCSVCGSNLMSFYSAKPDIVGMPIGGLDQAPSNLPLGHIFAASKAPWFEITDTLPQHDNWPGTEAHVRATRP